MITTGETEVIIFLRGLGRLTCSGIDALPSFPGACTVSSSSRFVVEGVSRESDVVPRRLIQFCLYLSLTSCIPEISSSFLMTSLLILSSLVYPVTLLRRRISAASRRGNRSIGRKPCPGATTSDTNITRTELVSNAGPARHATASDQNYSHKYVTCLKIAHRDSIDSPITRDENKQTRIQ